MQTVCASLQGGDSEAPSSEPLTMTAPGAYKERWPSEQTPCELVITPVRLFSLLHHSFGCGTTLGAPISKHQEENIPKLFRGLSESHDE